MIISTSRAFQINLVLRQGSMILLSVLLVKNGVSSELIGIFETLMFVGTTISFFWINAFLQGTLTQYASSDEVEKKELKFNIFLITNILSIIIFFILWVFKEPFLLFFTYHAHLPFFDIFTIYLLFNLPPFLLESFWIVENKPLSILTYAVLSYTLLPLSIMLPLWLGYGFELSMWGMVAVSLIRYIVLIINVLNNHVFTINPVLIKAFLVLCLPLVGYTFLGGLVTTFSNWIVNWYYEGNKTIFALFRFGAREFPLVLALTTGLSSAVVPLLASTKFKKTDLNLLKNKSVRLWHILFPTSILLMLTSKWLFKTVFSSSYSASADIFNIYLLLLLSRALFPQSILIAKKETSSMLKISIIESIFIVGLSFILIFPLGLAGVAWATVIGFMIEKILMIIFLQKRHTLQWRQYTQVNLYFFYSLLLIAAYIVSLL